MGADTTTETAPEPSVTPIWQHSMRARWMVSVASDLDPDDYHSGWTNVDADAMTGTVDNAGVLMTPTEARNLADALRQAADHAEHFCHNRATFLEGLADGYLAEIEDWPSDRQRELRDALRAVAGRYRDCAVARSAEAVTHG